MDVQQLKVERATARELFQKYKASREAQTPADREIEALYRRIAQGQTVIRALESIRVAGCNAEGMPRLALARADERRIECRITAQGEATFEPPGNCRSRSRVFRVQGLVGAREWKRGEGIVPLIPVYLRPKHSLSHYHILWEAEWSRVYPVDPYLLRRFGTDAWVVVAAWELTDVERAVMAQRIGR